MKSKKGFVVTVIISAVLIHVFAVLLLFILTLKIHLCQYFYIDIEKISHIKNMSQKPIYCKIT